jgi:hypothetical protein
MEPNMNLKTTIIAGTLALACGAALMILADRQGWLNQNAETELPEARETDAVSRSRQPCHARSGRPRQPASTASAPSSSMTRLLRP